MISYRTTEPADLARALAAALDAAHDARVAQLNSEATEHRLPDGTRLPASAVDDDSATLDVAVERMIEEVQRGE